MVALGALSLGVDSRGLVQTLLLCFFHVIVSYKSPLFGDRLYGFLQALPSTSCSVAPPTQTHAVSAPPLTAERMREADR